MTLATRRAADLLLPDARARVGDADEDGWLDLLEEAPETTGAAQSLMLTSVVPSIYERWWRPALGRAVKGLTGPGMAEEVRIARLLLGLTSGHKVLDVACGPGNFTRAFGRAVGEEGLAVGADVSETMLRKGARDTERLGPENVALVRAAATDLPFADGSFDGVSCFAALHLFADPLDALSEMTRVIAPGGRIAVMTSVRRPLAPTLLKPLVERASGMRVFEPDEVVAALRMRGYGDIHQRISGVIQFVGAQLQEGGARAGSR